MHKILSLVNYMQLFCTLVYEGCVLLEFQYTCFSMDNILSLVN